jgi:hypothetical protein
VAEADLFRGSEPDSEYFCDAKCWNKRVYAIANIEITVYLFEGNRITAMEVQEVTEEPIF